MSHRGYQLRVLLPPQHVRTYNGDRPAPFFGHDKENQQGQGRGITATAFDDFEKRVAGQGVKQFREDFPAKGEPQPLVMMPKAPWPT